MAAVDLVREHLASSDSLRPVFSLLVFLRPRPRSHVPTATVHSQYQRGPEPSLFRERMHAPETFELFSPFLFSVTHPSIGVRRAVLPWQP